MKKYWLFFPAIFSFLPSGYAATMPARNVSVPAPVVRAPINASRVSLGSHIHAAGAASGTPIRIGAPVSGGSTAPNLTVNALEARVADMESRVTFLEDTMPVDERNVYTKSEIDFLLNDKADIVLVEFLLGEKMLEIGELLEEVKNAAPGGGGNIELQRTATHIQWRFDDGNWENLIELSELGFQPPSAPGIYVMNVSGGVANWTQIEIVDEFEE